MPYVHPALNMVCLRSTHDAFLIGYGKTVQDEMHEMD